MNILRLLPLLLLLDQPALAQSVSQVQAQLGIDKTGSTKTLRILPPGATVQVPLGDVTSDGKFKLRVDSLPDTVIPDKTQVLTQPTSVSLDYYNLTGNDRTSRFAPCTSTGTHANVARYCNFVQHTFTGSSIAEGPRSADYAIGCSTAKVDWLTSMVPGETDCLTLFVRQGIGDAAGILSNVTSRYGFAATLESYTASVTTPAGADPGNQPIYAIGSQIGVVDSKLGFQYGNLTIAKTGANLTSAFQAQSDTGSSWYRAFSAFYNGRFTFEVDHKTGDIKTIGTITSGPVLNVGASTPDVAVIQMGAGRTANGPAYVDMFTDTTGVNTTRIIRGSGTNGNLDITNSGTGAIFLTTGGVARFTANSGGVAFNGNGPVAKQTLSAALPTDGSATNAQLATAYNSMRTALINYGLAQ